MNNTHAKRFNAQRAARRALKKPAAKEGIDFETFKTADGWTFKLIGSAGPMPANVASLDAHRKAKEAKKAAPKPSKAQKVKPLAAEPRMIGRYKAMLENALKGILPPVPTFSPQPEWNPYRKKLAGLVSMVERGDLAALMAHQMKPYDSGAKIIIRYRNFAIAALKAQRSAGRDLTTMSLVEWEQQQILEATKFTATKSRGRGVYDTREFDTLEQAGKGAHEMGNGTVIYALTPKGRQVMVGGIRKGTFEPTEAARTLADYATRRSA